MSGPVRWLQGLVVIPREVVHDEKERTLTRITEVWLVGDGADQGPEFIRSSGLLIGLGLQKGGLFHHNVMQFCFALGIRDQWQRPRTDWMQLAEPVYPDDRFAVELNSAFGHFGKWHGYHLTPQQAQSVNAPDDPRCESLLFRLVIDRFKPSRNRHFQVDAMVITLAGGWDLENHYLLGLGVLTTGKTVTQDGDTVAVIEDFMTVTHAMARPDRPAMPVEPSAACSGIAIGPPPANQWPCQAPKASPAPRPRSKRGPRQT